MFSRCWTCSRQLLFAGCLCLAAAPGFSQPQPPDGQTEGLPPVIMAVPPSRETVLALQHAREALKQNRLGDAVPLLQLLIDMPEDYFLDKTLSRTLKSETLVILSEMTGEQRQDYQLLQGAQAKGLFDDAVEAGDFDRLSEVVRRFPLTPASIDAAELLALRALDLGRPWQAAEEFSRLRRRNEVPAGRAAEFLLREAMARYYAGQIDRAAELLKEFSTQIGGDRVEVLAESLPAFTEAAQAKRWLTQFAGFADLSGSLVSAEWLNLRGNVDGTSHVSFTAPVGGPIWQVDLLQTAAVRGSAESASEDDTLARLYLETKELQDDSERLSWPTVTPLVVGDLVVFRTLRNVVALDRRTGELRWQSVLTDPDFDRLLRQRTTSTEPEEIEAELVSSWRERLFDDRTFGGMSSDGRLIYAVEGQDFYAAAKRIQQFNNRRFLGQPPGENVSATMNRLVAYEAQGGRLVWGIGGNRTDTEGEFADHFFLGPPVCDDGRLYVLAEVQGEIRLLQLEATASGVDTVWSQPLVAPTLKVSDSYFRRRQLFTPALAQGLVICPTGAGAVIAVNPQDRRLVWAYQYQSTDQAAMFASVAQGNGAIFGVDPELFGDEFSQGWIDGNPVVVDDRVFLTPVDSGELHCVSLTDGKPLWSLPRERAVLLAGADQTRAIVIGPDRMDAVDSFSGRPLWEEPLIIPRPVGRGVWMRDRYSLPLSTGEIATIDLSRGRILARSKISSGRQPGNLAVAAEGLISVSGDTVLAFATDSDVEQQIAKRLAAEPQDAQALGLRGERRLHQGEYDAGLADLRASLAASPQPYVKSVLAAALLDGLRTNFEKYRPLLAELDTLTDDPQQRHEFLWLAARGLNDSGDRVAAFQQMTQLLDQSLEEFSSTNVGSPWQSRNDRRLTIYFADLYQQATAAERETLDAAILRRLPATENMSAEEQIDALRRYLRTFGFHPSAVTARQRLVALLDPEKNDLEFLQELSRLADHTDPAVAAPAAAKLADWFVSRKRYADVAHSLIALEGRLSAAECEPGISGKAVAERLRENPDFQESLRFVPWLPGEIDKDYIEQPQQGGRMIRVPVEEPVPAMYAGWSFETDQQGQLLVARDDLARVRWLWNRNPNERAAAIMFRDSSPSQYRVHLRDHLVGWDMGLEFQIAADVEPDGTSPRVLWQEGLTPSAGEPVITGNRWLMQQQLQRLRLRGGRIINRPFQPFAYNPPHSGGALVALTDSAVIYHNGRKLIAADPLTGSILWSRKDLSASLFDVHADDITVSVLDHAGEFAGDSGNRESSLSLFNAVDGQRLSKTAPLTGNVKWIGGGRVVKWEIANEPSFVGLYDVTTQASVWEATLTRPATVQIVNQAEVFTLEENRRLTVRKVSDGAIRWSQELSLPVPVDTLIVQPWQDRYLVIAGTSHSEPGSVRAVGFPSEHQPIAGVVAALQRETGELLWQTPINEPVTDPTAFDIHQPAGWPVLLFAAQLWVPPPPGAAVQPPQRLTVTFLDKRTGKREYFAEQSSPANTYHVDLDTERNRLTANFLTWAVHFHYTGKPRK